MRLEKILEKRTRDEWYIYRVYLGIYIMSSLFIGLMSIAQYVSLGEARFLRLSIGRISMGLILVIHLIPLFFVPAFYKLNKRHRIRLSLSGKKLPVKLSLAYPRIHYFVLIVLIVQIAYTMRTGHGRVLSELSRGVSSGNSSSAILNMLNIGLFFPVYFVVAKRNSRLYWINTALFFAYELICGWTGFILEIGFYEAFILLKSGKAILLKKFLRLSIISVIAAIFLGALLYQYVASYKDFIRYGMYTQLTYPEALERLISRFTAYPVSVAGVQNHKVIADLYRGNHWYTEVISVFRSMLPSSLMPDKQFRTMNNIVLQSIHPDLTNSTSTGYSVIVLMFNLAESNFFAFCFWIISYLIFFTISKMVISAFDDGSHKTDALLFILCFQCLNGASIESLFGYGYIGMVYILAIMVALRVIKLGYEN